MLINEGHQQTPLTLSPLYTSDHAFRSLLQRTLPPATFSIVDDDLKRFQVRLSGPIRALSGGAEDVEPTLTQYDQWGRRVDVLKTGEAWRKLKGVAAEEGLVSIFAERKEGEFSRTIGFAKTYLWVPESHYVGCPISMTDGCARVIELYGTPEMKAKILPKLISRDPVKAWTAGQWMTEKPGGSDVSLTETVARPLDPAKSPIPGDKFILDGFKWFSSATDGNVALALARTGTVSEGARGLSLFLIELKDAQGGPNGIHVHRLKQKYGTKSLPTAELSLTNTIGELIGPLNQGVQTISSVLNITRLHSAISATSALRRSLSIAKSFAKVRLVGGASGSLLSQNQLHTSSLVQAEIVHRALLQLTFEVIRLTGRSEAEEIEESEGEKWRLRLLTPVVKGFCAVLVSRELPGLMESLGGQGYMEENEIGRLIRDSTVERIWEGTTNVLGLDVVRVILKSKGAAIDAFVEWTSPILADAITLNLPKSPLNLLQSSLRVLATTSKFYFSGISVDPRLSRHLLFFIGHLTSSFCLIEQALWSKEAADVEVAKRWIGGELEESKRAVENCTKADSIQGEKERAWNSVLVYGREEGRSKL